MRRRSVQQSSAPRAAPAARPEIPPRSIRSKYADRRTANGVPSLTWNSAKEQEALDRIKAVAQSGQLSHAGMPGSAENLTYVLGYGDTNTFYTNYYNSPSHNANMLYYSTNATSHSMVSATCIVTSGGVNSYYNVLIIYTTYPDSFVEWEW